MASSVLLYRSLHICGIPSEYSFAAAICGHPSINYRLAALAAALSSVKFLIGLLVSFPMASWSGGTKICMLAYGGSSSTHRYIILFCSWPMLLFGIMVVTFPYDYTATWASDVMFSGLIWPYAN